MKGGRGVYVGAGLGGGGLNVNSARVFSLCLSITNETLNPREGHTDNHYWSLTGLAAQWSARREGGQQGRLRQHKEGRRQALRIEMSK